MNRLLLFALSLSMGTLIASVAFAQIPDTYTNLKHLPKDIKKDELVEVMRSFSKALGVKCYHCHKGKEGQPLSTFDFASDENKHKAIARTMMTMVNDINTKYLKNLSSKDEPAKVQCMTCHQGKKKPETE